MANAADALLKKVRSNAAWNALSSEQRALLEDWLFEDNLSYQDAWLRAKRQFDYAGSKSSIRRFFERASQERAVAALIESKEQSAAIEGADIHVPQLCEAGMKIVAQMFLHQVTTQPTQTKQWGFFAKLVLRHQATQSSYAVRREENAIRHGQLALAREKWADELDQRARVERAEALEKEIKEREQAENPNSGTYRWNRRANRILYGLFGDQLAPDDMLPEDYAMDEAMKAAKALPPETAKAERQKIAAEVLKGVRERQAEMRRAEAARHEQWRKVAEKRLQEEAARKKADAAQREKELAEAAARKQPEPAVEAAQQPPKQRFEDTPETSQHKLLQDPKRFLTPILIPGVNLNTYE